MLWLVFIFLFLHIYIFWILYTKLYYFYSEDKIYYNFIKADLEKTLWISRQCGVWEAEKEVAKEREDSCRIRMAHQPGREGLKLEHLQAFGFGDMSH